MSVFTMLAQHADMAVQHLHVEARWSRTLPYITARSASTMRDDKLGSCSRERPPSLAAGRPPPAAVSPSRKFKDKPQNVQQEEQLGWLTAAGKYFIGIFQ